MRFPIDDFSFLLFAITKLFLYKIQNLIECCLSFLMLHNNKLKEVIITMNRHPEILEKMNQSPFTIY